jgi:succinyl-CoA synthetase beta subunit
MKLFEFEAKNILKKQGISFPRGDVAYSVDDVVKIAQKIGGPVVLKSQVLVSGRGKAGGILFADDIDTAQITAKKLFGSLIKGNRVTALLVEEKISIVEQLYASVTIDRGGGEDVT